MQPAEQLIFFGKDNPAQSSGVWSPAGIPGLIAWLESDAASITLDGSDRLTSLAGKFGTPTIGAGAAGLEPYTELDATDGRYWLRFSAGPTWKNGYGFFKNERVLDAADTSYWVCNVPHVSAAAGSFADDRTANPTYWSSSTLDGTGNTLGSAGVLTDFSLASQVVNIAMLGRYIDATGRRGEARLLNQGGWRVYASGSDIVVRLPRDTTASVLTFSGLITEGLQELVEFKLDLSQASAVDKVRLTIGETVHAPTVTTEGSGAHNNLVGPLAIGGDRASGANCAAYDMKLLAVYPGTSQLSNIQDYLLG
jgi:hypothetical protein